MTFTYEFSYKATDPLNIDCDRTYNEYGREYIICTRTLWITHRESGISVRIINGISRKLTKLCCDIKADLCSFENDGGVIEKKVDKVCGEIFAAAMKRITIENLREIAIRSKGMVRNQVARMIETI